MIRIIDDFIPEQYQDELLQTIAGPGFSWIHQTKTIANIDFINSYIDDRFQDTQYMVHKFNFVRSREQSQYYSLVRPLSCFFMERTEGMEVEGIIRSKANLTFPTPTSIIQPPHTDSDYVKSWSLLYYLNDIDGDTHFYEERSDGKIKHTDMTHVSSCTPKKGRAVLFPSNIFHASSTPTKGNRYVISMVLGIK